ncbi:RT RNaseH 2 domain-containing protein [Abeliophyllum distichum]|uniref:RT RNaseH 2 domain-containing protein n=1 Tax=Abeliophyllum distichum TaxID=126358 RepID=A0ABD1PEB6_9LAMI
MMIQTEPIDINHERVEEEMILDEYLDLRIIGSNSLASPTEELESFFVNSSDPAYMLQVGLKLDEKIKQEIKQFLRENIDVFAWKHSDMVGINSSVACHALKVDPKVRPKIQKMRPLSAKRYGALKEGVDKLLTNGFIREAVYPNGCPIPRWCKKTPRSRGCV